MTITSIDEEEDSNESKSQDDDVSSSSEPGLFNLQAAQTAAGGVPTKRTGTRMGTAMSRGFNNGSSFGKIGGGMFSSGARLTQKAGGFNSKSTPDIINIYEKKMTDLRRMMDGAHKAEIKSL